MSGTAIQRTCDYCGGHHLFTTCPRIKAIEYHQDGTVKRVEFHEARGMTTDDLVRASQIIREQPPAR